MSARPRIGEVLPGPGGFGTRTVVNWRQIRGDLYAYLVVGWRLRMPYQTWTWGPAGRNLDVRTYGTLERAVKDFRARR